MKDHLENVPSGETKRSWQPLTSYQCRVLGVLIEKAKTTPSAYPLTLNAVRVASNQKSNRSPQLTLEEDHVQDALDALRGLGAVSVFQGDSRVEKFRHKAHEWLGVDQVELAIMAELLLRGDQTVGELRGRAARMEPIADLAALRPLLDSLENKGLIVYLTPPGRGCQVTHALYQPKELDRLRSDHDAGKHATAAATSPASVPSSTAAPAGGELSALRDEVQSLRGAVEQLRGELAELRDELTS